ncbi:uncharacterized protein DUF1488 [Sphingomonas sp. PP-CE-3G-477]|uniref:DUF1488 family protein n=1 Tax=unclassified Sphingomonas TaxID=196159 RepID=UPI000D37115B|nr:MULTISPECIES: DUF1488 family protein [unclassified Sphingomonas]MBE2992035.1 DUF1488 family protein [Sphingomonas sp. CFBP 13603]PTQ64758.1 uncharacterized protein DUF1488 [Sphingomonas sp. PP-CE-3G-477]
MASALEIDQSSIVDNDIQKQIEFLGEFDGDEYEFAVKYAVLKELSGDEPEDDGIELFNRFNDDIVDACLAALERKPGASTIVVDENDLE